MQTSLRTKGWIVPNYNAPKGEEQTEMLRVVMRESITEDLVERLVVDILECAEAFMGECESLLEVFKSWNLNHPSTAPEGSDMMIASAGGTMHQPDIEVSIYF